MKKKILSLLMAATLVVGMTGCVQKPGSEGSDAKDGDKGGKGGYELALITDVGTLMTSHLTREHGKDLKNTQKTTT